MTSAVQGGVLTAYMRSARSQDPWWMAWNMKTIERTKTGWNTLAVSPNVTSAEQGPFWAEFVEYTSLSLSVESKNRPFVAIPSTIASGESELECRMQQHLSQLR